MYCAVRKKPVDSIYIIRNNEAWKSTSVYDIKKGHLLIAENKNRDFIEFRDCTIKFSYHC